MTGIYRLHGHLHLGEIWAFFKALDKSKDSTRGPGQCESGMKLLMRRYKHVQNPGEREGLSWQLPRDILAWLTLVAEEGCVWDVIDWEWGCSIVQLWSCPS